MSFASSTCVPIRLIMAKISPQPSAASHNRGVANLWDKWRAFSDRVSTALVSVCAILSVLGGLELLQVQGPPYIAVLFIGFGAAMLCVVVYAMMKKS